MEKHPFFHVGEVRFGRIGMISGRLTFPKCAFLFGYSLLNLFQCSLPEGGFTGQDGGLGCKYPQLPNLDLIILVQSGVFILEFGEFDLKVVNLGGQVCVLAI